MHKRLVAGALVAWAPVDRVLSALGVVDTVRGAIDPQGLVARVLFFPYLGFVMTALGILFVAFLAVRVREHRRAAAVMIALADEGTGHRDKKIAATDVVDFAVEYGRWHQRAIDTAAPYLGRFPFEAQRVKVNGGLNFNPLNDALTVDPVHAKLRGIIAVRTTDLRELAHAVQGIPMWE